MPALFCERAVPVLHIDQPIPGEADDGHAILAEAATLCGDVFAPLNVEGDRNPSSWRDGKVSATPGFREAFRQFAEGGWQGVAHPVEPQKRWQCTAGEGFIPKSRFPKPRRNKTFVAVVNSGVASA